jgi:hypothetical protein
VVRGAIGTRGAGANDCNRATDMEKKKPDGWVSSRPIAKRILAKMKLQSQRKVVNIKNVITGRRIAEELQQAVVSQKDLAGFQPAHAAYVYTQNQASVMSQQLTALKEMGTFVDIISRAEDLYMPSAPPMSPLTTSYFSCWAFFDACAGPANETIGTTILEVGAAFGMHLDLLRLMRLMLVSRMGFYGTGLTSHARCNGELGHSIARSTIADMLGAADFFTVEVWARRGLRRFMVLFFRDLSSRRVEVAGLTRCSPPTSWRSCLRPM